MGRGVDDGMGVMLTAGCGDIAFKEWNTKIIAVYAFYETISKSKLSENRYRQA
jgi:hypothetical protein